MERQNRFNLNPVKKNRNEEYSRSLTYFAWQRMKKNRLAVFGIVTIGFCIVISLLGQE